MAIHFSSILRPLSLGGAIVVLMGGAMPALGAAIAPAPIDSSPVAAGEFWAESWLHPGLEGRVIPRGDRLSQSSPPPFPRLPATIPDVQAPAIEGILGIRPDPNADIGIGHLRPRDLDQLPADNTESPSLQADWLQSTTLPIYAEPEGQPWGWLMNGWLVPNGSQPLAIGQDAAFLMLQTADNLFTFPVMEVRSDGWFRFQYTPAGTAWAHESHLAQSEIELVLETWEDHFLRADWVTFRRHGVAQTLRPEPNGNSSILTLVGPDSLIEPLAFEGNWMRVRVTQPAEACTPLPGARTEEGWIRWRSEQGADPLVWHSPTRC